MIPHYVPSHVISGSLGAVQVAATPFVIWFGLSDEMHDTVWRWSSTGLITTYYEWDINALQPDNNPGADYGCFVVPFIKWHDSLDTLPIPFMCEYGVK